MTKYLIIKGLLILKHKTNSDIVIPDKNVYRHKLFMNNFLPYFHPHFFFASLPPSFFTTLICSEFILFFRCHVRVSDH